MSPNLTRKPAEMNFVSGGELDADAFRDQVSSAATLLLTNALAGEAAFLMMVFPLREREDGSLELVVDDVKFGTNGGGPEDVVTMLRGALHAATAGDDDEGGDHDHRRRAEDPQRDPGGQAAESPR